MRGTGRVFKRPNSTAWWIAYCHRGKEFRESSGSDDDRVAERLLKRRLKEIGADSLGLKPFVGPQQDRLTVGEMLDALESDFNLRGLKSLNQTRGHVRVVRKAFGDLRALNVTPNIVTRYIESELAEGKAPATVNRRTTLLGEAFRLAVRRRQISVMPEIPRLRENNARRGFFDKAEFEGVASHLPWYLIGFVQFAYHSGWRKGEIRSLEWTDVDMLGKVIRLRPENSKTNEGRVLALECELWNIITRQWAIREYQLPNKTIAASMYVFHRNGEPIGDIRKSWEPACKAAGVQGKLFHDLRRTAIRNMVRAGVGERVAMSISVHKTRAIFDRYNIVSEDDLRMAVERTQTYLNSMATKETVAVFPKANKAATA